MKWIVYVLLGVNLTLLTWNLHNRGTATATSAPGPVVASGVGELPLLTELESDGLRARVSATVVEAGAGAEPDAEPETEPTVAAAPDAVPGPTPSVPVDTPEAPLPDSAEALVTAPAPVAAPGTTCLTVGPLGEDAPVDAVGEWLKGLGAEVEVRSDERREVALYWIYFPPTATRAEAVTQVERMRAEGIDDVLVVPKGDMANAVSLGVFSRTDSRDRRLKELNDKGYRPSIAPRYRTKRATWVDASAPIGSVSPDTVRQRWPDLAVAPTACAGARIAAGQAGSYNSYGTPRPPRRFFFSDQGRATTGQ